jgi:predicted RNA-binding Zn ribbon-like protein
MEELSLDPNGYRGTYKLVGGRTSLDFVNTISWPNTDRAHDWFDSIGNVEQWLAAAGLASAPRKRSNLNEVTALRETLAAVLRSLAHGRNPSKSGISELNHYVSISHSRRVINPETLAWTWKRPERILEAFAPVLLDAAELITAHSHERLRYCPSCDWLFEDHTRNGKRRWCDMADCGSRDKANRYYHRSK